jgi:hypothetical protein
MFKMVWYNPFDWAERVRGYFSRRGTLEVEEDWRQDLRMYRKLLSDADCIRAGSLSKMECTRDPRRLEAEYLRRMDLHERAQRVDAENLVLNWLRVNRLHPVF